MSAPTWLGDDDDDLATTEYNAVMDTVEMHVPTTPLPRADLSCAWCDIRLAAIPDLPKPVHDRDGNIVYCHPHGCVSAYRNSIAGIPRL